MPLQNTTPVPNRVFDLDLARLKEVELKTLMVIIRKTAGWVNAQNHRQRKQIERISIHSFELNTGCSRRGISAAIQSLITKGLIRVYDHNGTILPTGDDRKGKYDLYFEVILPTVENRRPMQNMRITSANFFPKPWKNFPNTIKEREQKKGKETGYIPSAHHISRTLKGLSYGTR